MSDWSSPVSARVAAVRAGGRRGYNSLRHDQMLIRRRRVKELAVVLGPGKGLRRAIADQLGISLSVVTRDLAALKADLYCNCPGCGFYRQQQKTRKVKREQRDPVVESIYAGKSQADMRAAPADAAPVPTVVAGRSRWR